MRLPLKTYPSVTWINAGRRPDAYAHDLYSNLRALDKAGCEQILVQDVPSEEKWTAIRDRLSRGAARRACKRARPVRGDRRVQRPAVRSGHRSHPWHVPWLAVGKLVLNNLDTIIGVVKPGFTRKKVECATHMRSAESADRGTAGRGVEQRRTDQAACRAGQGTGGGAGAGRDRSRSASRCREAMVLRGDRDVRDRSADIGWRFLAHARLSRRRSRYRPGL